MAHFGLIMLSVLMPVWNERATIDEIVSQVLAVPLELELIIIDNGSTDGTRDWLRTQIDNAQAVWADAENQTKVRIWFQAENRGKGASVRRALELARGDWVIVQDADLEYDPRDYVKLLRAAERVSARQKRAKNVRDFAVFGSRLRRSETRRAQGKGAFFWGRVGLSLGFQLLYARALSDVATCYKLLPRDLARRLNLQAEGFDLDFEIAARLVRVGAHIYEVPISYVPRSKAQGKKIRPVYDGYRAARALLLHRFL